MHLEEAIAALPAGSPFRDAITGLMSSDPSKRARAARLLRERGRSRPHGDLPAPEALAVLGAALDLSFPSLDGAASAARDLVAALLGSATDAVVELAEERYPSAEPRMQLALLALIASAASERGADALAALIGAHGWPVETDEQLIALLAKSAPYARDLVPDLLEAPGASLHALADLLVAALRDGHLEPSAVEGSPLVRDALSRLGDVLDDGATHDPARSIRVDLAGYLGGDEVLPALRSAQHTGGRMAALAIASLLRRGEPVDDATIERVAADDDAREALYTRLRALGAAERIPQRLRSRDAFAAADMVRWLSRPGALGRPPAALEAMQVLERVQDGAPSVLYVWRFRAADGEPWRAAVSGHYPFEPPEGPLRGSHTFSRFDAWDTAAPEAHADRILGALKAWSGALECPPLTLAADGATEVWLSVRVDPDAVGVTIRQDAADRLVSRHVDVLRRDFHVDSGESLTTEVPKMPPDLVAHLDPRGLVKVGTRVEPGDVLAGATVAARHIRHFASETPFEAASRRRREPRDYSLRVPPTLRGRVTRAEHVVLAPGVCERVEIELTDERPLAIGDRLGFGNARAVVTRIADELDTEMVWPGAAAPEVLPPVRKLACAVDQHEARSIGPYSLITQQPLGGKASFGGQRLTEAHRWALEAAGAWTVLHEMLTVKSDDVQGRLRVYESIVRGRAEMEPCSTESTGILTRELEALGLTVRTVLEETDDDRADTPVPTRDAAGSPRDIFSFFAPPPEPSPDGPLRIALSSSERIRERSRGRVQRGETIHYRTLLPVEEGLFCARIFGPVRDYECLCGAIQGMKNRDATCEQCGVEVIASKVRRERVGHVELPGPLLHPWARRVTAALLGTSVRTIDGVLYEGRTLSGGDATEWRSGHAWLLRDALSRVDLDRVAREGGVAGALADAMRRSGVRPERLVFDAWPILPPDLRPIIPLSGGRFVSSDLNDLYRRLVNRCNRLARLLELGAPAGVLGGEHQQLQRALDDVVHNGARGATVAVEGRPLKSLTDMIAGPSGRFAFHLGGKRVDYSGAAVAVSADAAPGEVLLPRQMARELFTPWTYGALEEAGHVQTIKAAKRLVEARDPLAEQALEDVVAHHPVVVFAEDGDAVGGFDVRLWDAPAVGLSTDDLELLRLGVDGRRVVVHVPIDARAIEETGTRLRPAGRYRWQRRPRPSGWIGRAARATDVAEVLLEAALAEESDPVADLDSRAILSRSGGPD